MTVGDGIPMSLSMRINRISVVNSHGQCELDDDFRDLGWNGVPAFQTTSDSFFSRIHIID